MSGTKKTKKQKHIFDIFFKNEVEVEVEILEAKLEILEVKVGSEA